VKQPTQKDHTTTPRHHCRRAAAAACTLIRQAINQEADDDRQTDLLEALAHLNYYLAKIDAEAVLPANDQIGGRP
jgi:hypothetical protein